MPVRLYFDHNVNQAVVHGLRLRGLDVVTAFEATAPKLRAIASKFGDSDSDIQKKREVLEQIMGASLPTP